MINFFHHVDACVAQMKESWCFANEWVMSRRCMSRVAPMNKSHQDSVICVACDSAWHDSLFWKYVLDIRICDRFVCHADACVAQMKESWCFADGWVMSRRCMSRVVPMKKSRHDSFIYVTCDSAWHDFFFEICARY